MINRGVRSGSPLSPSVSRSLPQHAVAMTKRTAALRRPSKKRPRRRPAAEAATAEESAEATTAADAPLPSRSRRAPRPAEAPAAGAAMTVTYTLSDAAVWNDGTPITAADFQCTMDADRQHARVDHHGRLRPDPQRREGASDQGGRRRRSIAPFAAWKTMFGHGSLLKARPARRLQRRVRPTSPRCVHLRRRPVHDDRVDARAGRLREEPGLRRSQRWPRPRGRVVPAEDGPTLAEVRHGRLHLPAGVHRHRRRARRPERRVRRRAGRPVRGPVLPAGRELRARRDPFVRLRRSTAFRQGFSKSIDLDGVYEQIYAPFAQGVPLLECGPIAPGPYCDPVFVDTYDPAGGEAALTEGWLDQERRWPLGRRRGQRPADPLDGQHRQHPP